MGEACALKWWKKALLKVPKVGTAYRAYRWHKVAKLMNRLRRLRKIAEENPDMLLKALKSKTVWFGIFHEVYGLVELWGNGGAIDRDVILPVVSGILIIILRAVTNKPLSEK